MKLIAGLGNIGREYENTRHNIGFMVVEELARRWGIAWKTDNTAAVAERRLPERVLLVRPQTYMNLSGIAVGGLANYYKIGLEDIAVVQDDLDLPSGKLRIRRKGSAGGHNGIISVQEHLGSDEFVRFKVGIGHPENEDKAVVRHVLTRFGKEEGPLITEAIKKTADAVEYWLEHDVDEVMNKFNG